MADDKPVQNTRRIAAQIGAESLHIKYKAEEITAAARALRVSGT